MAPGVGGTSQPAPSPAHTGGGGGHRGVQRSISATSSNKPRRGSTGADNTCELMSGAGGGTVGGEGEGGQGRSWLIDVSTGPGSLGGTLVFQSVVWVGLHFLNWVLPEATFWGKLWGVFGSPRFSLALQNIKWVYLLQQFTASFFGGAKSCCLSERNMHGSRS